MGLTDRAWGSVFGALALGVALAAFLSFSSISDAAVIVDRGAPAPKVSKPDRSLASASPVWATPASADGFWTPERMASAKPLDNAPRVDPLDVPSFGHAASASAAKGDFTPNNVTAFPQVVQGKIFFVLGQDTYSCSGTLVDSASRNVVFTAGHCVFDLTEKRYVDKLAFVPGYENQTAPFGILYATRGFAPDQWRNKGNNSYDLAAVTLDTPIQSKLGARQLAFDLNPMVSKKKRRQYTVYGYPSQPSDRFNGEVLRGCHVTFDSFDSTPPNSLPYPMAANPCNMEQGASGGGWITLGNYLNSVVSYGYCESLPRTCGTIFGPFFSNAAKSLYGLAGGSPAPTLKVLKAPPKVVRKRKVRFKFGGSAATLLGFTCKLDRQKKVGCSSRISISRLSPGKHTLRVRAVDQTGHMSKRTIVRRFRVVLKRR